MVNFFKCGECESVMLEMGAPEKVCKSADMALLCATTSDGAVEKHVPVASYEHDRVVIRVGSAPHPMLPEHYIEWIYVKTSFGGVYVDLDPGDEPEAELKLLPGEVEEVYIYCNLHGLWKAAEPVLPMDFDQNTVACSPEFAAGCVNPSAKG